MCVPRQGQAGRERDVNVRRVRLRPAEYLVEGCQVWTVIGRDLLNSLLV